MVSFAVVTTNCEKSADAIVGGNTEGLNNKSCETNVCLCEYPTADVGETYMSRKRTT